MNESYRLETSRMSFTRNGIRFSKASKRRSACGVGSGAARVAVMWPRLKNDSTWGRHLAECPVFDRQFRNASELARIVGDQRQAKTTSMGGDKQVVGADHRPARF